MNKEQASILLYGKLHDIAKQVTPDVEYTIQQHMDSIARVSSKWIRDLAIKVIARNIWRNYSFPHDYYDEEVPYWARSEIETAINDYLTLVDKTF